MKATSEDQFHTVQTRRRPPVLKLLLAAGVLAALVVFLLRDTDDAGDSGEQPVVEPTPIASTPTPALPPAPDIPRKADPEPAPAKEVTVEETATEPPLPTPEEADALLMQSLDDAAVDKQLREVFSVPHPLDAGVAMLDWLAQGVVPRKLLALPDPGEFPVAEVGDQLLMDDAAYARYDNFAGAVATVDVAALADTFHRLRPVLERAYGALGLDEDKFDNAVIRALDQVLATPEIEKPIVLERESVMYTYADPALENLAELQKQLLRMGPDNLRIIKQQARALRRQLLSG